MDSCDAEPVVGNAENEEQQDKLCRIMPQSNCASPDLSPGGSACHSSAVTAINGYRFVEIGVWVVPENKKAV